MTVPHDRSMPAVRMISVWPMASVPITITCWMISEKFSVVMNRDDCVQKKRHAMISANSGPSCASRSPETFGRPPRPLFAVGGGAPPGAPAPAVWVSGWVTV